MSRLGTQLSVSRVMPTTSRCFPGPGAWAWTATIQTIEIGTAPIKPILFAYSLPVEWRIFSRFHFPGQRGIN